MNLPWRNAGESLADRIRKAYLFELVYLDAEVRRGGWSFANDFGIGYWYDLKPADVRRHPAFGVDTGVTGLFSFHPSGYIREAAVDGLDQIHTGREVAFLLLRLDDWVSQVRSRARWALRNRLGDEHRTAWIHLLPLLLRLKRRQRFLDEALVDDALALIRRSIAEGTQTGLGLPDSDSRRWWAAAMYDTAATDEQVFDVTERLLSHSDTEVRQAAAQRVRESNRLAENPAVMERLLSDRAPAVRREAAEFLACQCAQGVTPRVVQSLLLDRAVQVRRIAQEQLAPLVQIDPPAVYLDTLRSPGGNLVTVLRGLGETGSKANVGAILPFWDDDRPGVQRAAVAARASLDPDPNPAPFLDKLVNPRPGVSREAERALESRLHLVPVHVLTELFDSSDLHHVRSNTFRLLARLGKWASIAPILHGLSPRFGEEINERAHAFLNRWFGRYNVDWSVPRKSDLDALETALREQSDVPYRGFLVAVLAEWRERIGA